jgi:tetratricopeptide (TPR) repeat protein
MSDPLRTDPLPEAGEVPERDRDARIEALLVAGLDHYFAGQHELAISVWTRVLFLDRGHARAKAYIDRARGAIAERQREGEELLHTGAAAFDRGDAGAARRLLNSAVERGAGSEEALVLLERLNRLEQATVRLAPASAPRRQSDEAAEPPVVPTDKAGSSRIALIATGVLAGLAAAGVVGWIALTRPEWLPVTTRTATRGAAQIADPLPVPSPAEIWLARARKLYEDGRVRDALRALDSIGQSDPRRAEADELRAAMQRTLLDAARVRPGRSTGVSGPNPK